ncbi:MAG: PIN domain-containing protein [Acidimicrobiia bacterium]|nr:PIN domain-containing protein [Acidimicrobiia bacterium]
MIAVDTNLLVYAHRRDSAFHKRAAELLQDLAEGDRSWAIPWPCIHEFLAIASHPRIFSPPTPPERAVGQVDAWMESPTLSLLGEGPGYWRRFRATLESGAIAGPRVHDARVAALCADAGATELWTTDRDFSRYPIRVRNPLLDG